MDSDETRQAIFQKLVYRKDCRGRALSAPITELGLHKYDRLVPTASLPDVAGFERKIIPFLVKFWRMKKLIEFVTTTR